MLRTTISILAGLALAACAAAAPEPRPLDVEAMPVSFDYGSLAKGKHEAEEVMDSRTGFTMQHLAVQGRKEWAVINVSSLIGDYVFTSTDAKSWVRRMLKPDIGLSWGESGTVREGSRPITWQTFTFTDPKPQACAALSQILREHIETDPARAPQELVIAIYCRDGSLPIDPAELPSIAAALRTRA